MKKVIMSVIVLFVVGSSSVVLACSSCGCQLAKSHDHGDAHHADAAAVAAPAPVAVAAELAAPVNAGNKFCPVMGNPVGNDSPHKVEYKGKLYNLCCPACASEFLKDPEAALKKLAEKEASSK